MSFDYDTPAELFLSKRVGFTRSRYRRFAAAAEAIRYVTLERGQQLVHFGLGQVLPDPVGIVRPPSF